ncbi:MAG: PTS transporter subunit EIIC [Acidaminococcaceae bacterium]|nr:PTS transporter subunit EIIC [Acidaminococcaceae bacterium]
MTNKELALEIYRVIGPAGNILHAENCMTRLRLQLKSCNFSKDELKKIVGVMGVSEAGPELQIVLGPGKAAKVCTEFKALLVSATKSAELGQTHADIFGEKVGESLHAEIKAKNSTPFKLFLKKIANIFMPLIPAFIGCGLITGLLNVVLKIEPSLADAAIIKILIIAGNAVFWGLNFFVGVNAAKEFGGLPILGGVLGVVISHPLLASVTLFGEQLVPGRGGVIAVILVVAFSSWLEKKLHKIVPEILDLFLTPFLVIVISSLVAIVVLQPIGGLLSEAIGALAIFGIAQGGAITGFVLGGLYLPIVLMGLHQGLTPIHAELISRTGVTILLPILAMAGAGQVGAAIAVYFKTKNSRLKKTIASALPVGIMGVGEPLIYGVTLPLGKPFVGAAIGGGFGGAVQASYVVGVSVLGISGLPLAATANNIPAYLLGLVTAYIVGFIATWLIGFDDPKEE